MENKYYIDENGLIVLVKSISNSIIEHTSGEIVFREIENQETGQTERVLEKPNNFPTVKAVTDYLKNRKKIKFVQDSNSEVRDDNFNTTQNEQSYNGEEAVQIDMKLATSEDIRKLFRR